MCFAAMPVAYDFLVRFVHEIRYVYFGLEFFGGAFAAGSGEHEAPN